MQKLKNKAAIITGSTSGIGLGIAHKFAAEGANLVINGFGDAAEIEKIRSELADKHKVKVVYSPADMSKPAEIKAMVALAEKEFGQLDILVNNAGIQFTALTEDFPDEKWEQILSINLSAAFYASKAALAGMKKRGFGRIINIASAHGLVASPQKAAYVAAKHGILGLTKVIALENAEGGVTCNAICPGWVLTPLVQKQIEARAAKEGCDVRKAELELLSEKQPSKRFTTPEQLGDLAVFLSTDSAANMTGASYTVDGGWTAQ